MRKQNRMGETARASERERKIGPRVCSIIAPNGRIIRLHVQIAAALLVKCLQQLAIIVLLPARRAAPHLIWRALFRETAPENKICCLWICILTKQFLILQRVLWPIFSVLCYCYFMNYNCSFSESIQKLPLCAQFILTEQIKGNQPRKQHCIFYKQQPENYSVQVQTGSDYLIWIFSYM